MRGDRTGTKVPVRRKTVCLQVQPHFSYHDKTITHANHEIIIPFNVVYFVIITQILLCILNHFGLIIIDFACGRS